MSDIFVSSYHEIIRDAFDKALGNEIPFNREKVIKDFTDKLCTEIIDNIQYYISDNLFQNIKDDLCRKAAEIATSMLKDALSGDDETIQNLFGFRYEYIHFKFAPYNVSGIPTQYHLINAIVKANPDIFINERIRQLEWKLEYHETAHKNLYAKNTELFNENMRLKSQIEEEI